MDPNIFPNGTLIKAKRRSRHGIVYSRPTTVAKVPMRLLKRSNLPDR